MLFLLCVTLFDILAFSFLAVLLVNRRLDDTLSNLRGRINYNLTEYASLTGQDPVRGEYRYQTLDGGRSWWQSEAMNGEITLGERVSDADVEAAQERRRDPKAADKADGVKRSLVERISIRRRRAEVKRLRARETETRVPVEHLSVGHSHFVSLDGGKTWWHTKRSEDYRETQVTGRVSQDELDLARREQAAWAAFSAYIDQHGQMDLSDPEAMAVFTGVGFSLVPRDEADAEPESQ